MPPDQRSWTLWVHKATGAMYVVCPYDDPVLAAEYESVPVVEAVLTDALVEKLAAVISYGYPHQHPDDNAGPEETIREVLRAAGFRASDKEGG